MCYCGVAADMRTAAVGKDLTWYAKGKNGERAADIAAVKAAEAELMNAELCVNLLCLARAHDACQRSRACEASGADGEARPRGGEAAARARDDGARCTGHGSRCGFAAGSFSWARMTRVCVCRAWRCTGTGVCHCATARVVVMSRSEA